MLKKKVIILLSDLVAIAYFSVYKVFVFLKFVRPKRGLRILLYHSISTEPFCEDLDLKEECVSLRLFKQQMAILKKASRKIVSLDEGIRALKENDLPCDCIAITFDDGIADSCDMAARILGDFNIPATFFIVYKYIDSKKKLIESGVHTKKCFADWDMLSFLQNKGFGIGSHSYSHKRLSTLDYEDLDKETVYVKKQFKDAGIQVEYFAYPYGFHEDFSDKTEESVRKAEYKACLTDIMGNNYLGDNLYRLKRTRVSWRDRPFRFRMKINGAYDWVDRLKYRLFAKKMESANSKNEIN